MRSEGDHFGEALVLFPDVGARMKAPVELMIHRFVLFFNVFCEFLFFLPNGGRKQVSSCRRNRV